MHFQGFGHPATLVVALGANCIGWLGQFRRCWFDNAHYFGQLQTPRFTYRDHGAVGAVLSAFMNNVAALALLMPVDLQTAKKAKRAVGLSLMPLSFATILGGMVTMIGTPPNIIIATIREDSLGEHSGCLTLHLLDWWQHQRVCYLLPPLVGA
jgi:hypothetical protein